MNQSIPGIKSILLCDLGTLLTTPTNPFFVGIGDKAKLSFADYKTTKDAKNRQLRNMILASLSCASMQPTLKMLNAMWSFINLNMDVQVVTDKQSSASGSEDVFQFIAGNSFNLGLGFEYSVDMEKRQLKVDAKGAADGSVVRTLIDSADSATAVTVSGVIHPGGEDWDKQRSVNLSALERPISTDLAELGELEDIKLTIKANTKDNIYGQPIVSSFTNTVEATIRNASVANLVAQLAKTADNSVLIKYLNSGSYYDAFQFAAGVLAPKEVIEIGDDNRNVKITLEGDVRPFEYTLNAGSSYGGADSDGGLNGGTLVVGY